MFLPCLVYSRRHLPEPEGPRPSLVSDSRELKGEGTYSAVLGHDMRVCVCVRVCSLGGVGIFLRSVVTRHDISRHDMIGYNMK